MQDHRNCNIPVSPYDFMFTDLDSFETVNTKWTRTKGQQYFSFFGRDQMS